MSRKKSNGNEKRKKFDSWHNFIFYPDKSSFESVLVKRNRMSFRLFRVLDCCEDDGGALSLF